jgi:hypothetical protein
MVLKRVRGDQDGNQGFVCVWKEDFGEGRVGWTSGEVPGV